VAVSPPRRWIDREVVEGYLFADDPRRILLFRRPPARGGFWAPVSGKVDPTDGDYEAAMRRELREETGFDSPRRLFPLDWEVVFEAPMGGEIWRLHAFGIEVPADAEPRLSEEHDRFEWLAPSEARDRLHYPDNKQALDRLLEILDRPGG
jgi:lipoyl(octanoyl) transferase